MTAVFFVTHDGMTKILGMNPNLVFAASIQMEVHQRIPAVTNQHLIMRDGEFSAIVGRTGIGDKHLVVLEP